MVLPDPIGRDESLVRVGGWHLDVDDGNVRPPTLDEGEERLGIAGLACDLEPGVREDPRDTLADERGVIGDHDAHGTSARTRVSWIVSRPSSAPTRSAISTRRAARSGSALSVSTSTISNPFSCRTRTDAVAAPLTASATVK